MEINKKIVQSIVNKSFTEAKDLVFKSMYAKASLALDDARFVVTNSVFNEVEADLEEAKGDTGYPAGLSANSPEAKKARANIKHKVRLSAGKPAGASNVKEDAEPEEAKVGKVKKSILVQKVKDGKKIGSPRPIPKYQPTAKHYQARWMS